MPIPKIIHYCWLGGNPLPELAEKCIASWEKYCPDYEIVRWDETNFDLDCCDYVREAYEAKMWAFVSDYARFKILYEHGGLYFDTDVELLKPMDDIVARGPFMGCEQRANGNSEAMVAPGLGLGAEPGMAVYREILDDYENTCFEPAPNGDYETVVGRTTRILSRYGSITDDAVCRVEGIDIYPTEYFCPMNYYTGEVTITGKTYAIHHYMASWTNKRDKRIIQINRKFAKHKKLTRVLTLPLRVMCRIDQSGWKETVRFAAEKLKTTINYRGGGYCVTFPSAAPLNMRLEVRYDS